MVSYRLREAELVFIATRSDSGDMMTVSKKAQRARWSSNRFRIVLELILTVLPHPFPADWFPGYISTFTIQALNRQSTYQFEDLIVILMFARLWQVWKCFKLNFFRRHFEQTIFLLGNQRSIIDMFLHRRDFSHALAIKMLFRKTPLLSISTLVCGLFMVSAYCMRVAESSTNEVHSKYYWNNIWLVVVTFCTVGYGDTYPLTHLGRMVAVIVMGCGIVIASVMTAALMRYIELSRSEKRLVQSSDLDRARRYAMVASVNFLQYTFRLQRGYIKGIYV